MELEGTEVRETHLMSCPHCRMPVKVHIKVKNDITPDIEIDSSE